MDICYKNGEIFGCDHGVTFHEDFKLRTVLWQFADMALNQKEIQALSSFNLDLAPLLTEREQQALQERIANLLQINRFQIGRAHV